MGSVGSRGKKVAPASQKEASADGEQRDRRGAGGSLRPSKIQTVSDLSQSRDRAPPACHSEGHDSEISADDYDVMDAELDRVLAEYDGTRDDPGEISRKGGFARCDTYGFCHPGREYKGSGFRSSYVYNSELSKETLHPCDVDRRVDFKKDFYGHHSRPALYFPDRPNGLREKESFQDHSLPKETASVPGTCEATSTTSPVIQYNRSEEDLMETIEKEFS